MKNLKAIYERNHKRMSWHIYGCPYTACTRMSIKCHMLVYRLMAWLMAMTSWNNISKSCLPLTALSQVWLFFIFYYTSGWWSCSYILYCQLCGWTSQSTAMVMSRRSVNTCFWVSGLPVLSVHMTTVLLESAEGGAYFIINLLESM